MKSPRQSHPLFKNIPPSAIKISNKMQYSLMYPIHNFLKVMITTNAYTSFHEEVKKIDPRQKNNDRNYQMMDYRILGSKINISENDFGNYEVETTLFIKESDFESILDFMEAVSPDEQPFIKKYQINKTVEMAEIALLETNEDSNYSVSIKNMPIKYSPYIVISDGELYYYNDSYAAHYQHPCGYRTFVPLSIVQQYESVIDETRDLYTIPHTVEFEVLIEKEQNYDAYRLINYLKPKYPMFQFKPGGDKKFYCKVPINSAIQFHSMIIEHELKMNCLSDSSFILRAIFIETIHNYRDEKAAIEYLNTNEINLKDCIYYNSKSIAVYPLHLAAEFGMTELLQVILKPKYNIDINLPIIDINGSGCAAGNGSSALLLAVFSPPDKMLSTLEILIAAGANIHYCNANNQNILDLIITRINKIEDTEPKNHFKDVISYLRKLNIEESDEQKNQLDMFLNTDFLAKNIRLNG